SRLRRYALDRHLWLGLSTRARPEPRKILAGLSRRAGGERSWPRAAAWQSISGADVMSERKVLLGLIGANIMGSLSPAIFADAFAAAGIDGYYHLMDTDRMPGRTLPKLLDAVKTAGFSGVNITYPYKQDIIPLLD